MKYKDVIGGNCSDAEIKFPWLKDAVFLDAVIDIRNDYLIWKDGLWKSGTWESGFCERGFWTKRVIWYNNEQTYVIVTQDNKHFKEEAER